MIRFAVAVCRYCFSAWSGAAALFVINGIAEVTHPQFDSAIRSQLVLLRFPAYYALGFALVGAGIVGAGLVGAGLDSRFPGAGRSRTAWHWATALAGLGLALMVVDYLWVYRPLAAMIAPEQSVRPAEFVTLHHLSRWLNTVHVGLIVIAAAVVDFVSVDTDSVDKSLSDRSPVDKSLPEGPPAQANAPGG